MQKATDGGWDKVMLNCSEYNPWTKEIIEETYDQFDSRPVYSFIFNHDFAKALFGETRLIEETTKGTKTGRFVLFDQDWQYHLQQAVIDDNPIDYLYKQAIEGA